MKDILKEAIADAKAVRETALASAKIALEEAFTPRIQSMLSARLAEEAEEDTMEEEEEEMPTEGYENDEDGTPDPGPAIEEDDTEEDLDLESIIRELEEEPMDEEEEADAEVSVEPAAPVEEDEDVNIEEIIRALREEDDDDDDMEEPVTEGDDEDEDPVAEGEEETSKELEEAYRVIRYMKSKLNEVNLLNAKLLFSNKLFRNYSLSDAQKMKVIENFDRAVSMREIKLVYSTLCESLKNGVATKKKQSIKESYASKPAGKSTAPKKEILSEGFELAARWKKLANLK